MKFVHNLLDMEFASGGRPGSVVVAGHSQGAALALYASVTYWRRSWDGNASFPCTDRLFEAKVNIEYFVTSLIVTALAYH